MPTRKKKPTRKTAKKPARRSKPSAQPAKASRPVPTSNVAKQIKLISAANLQHSAGAESVLASLAEVRDVTAQSASDARTLADGNGEGRDAPATTKTAAPESAKKPTNRTPNRGSKAR